MKKLLALVLALVMSMSLVTISNAAFKDADKIDYKEAVDVMNAVGVFIGDEKGNFNAKENLTREQAAKIIAYLELGEKAADALVGSATFTDVAATRWSAGFVSYCAQAGVVSGYDGKFDPAGQLTALQFGKMLLVEIGYDAKAAGMVGTDWAINTSKLLATTGLMNGIDGSVNQVLTREKAAQMCLNALKTPTVEYATKGSNITVNGAEINFGASVPTYVTNTVAKEQTISNDTLTNSKEYTIELGEKLFKKLVLENNTTDAFGRPTHTWKLSTTKIGEYADEATLTYTKEVELGDIYADLGLSKTTTANEFWQDGKENKTLPSFAKKDDSALSGSNNGVLTQIYYDSDANDGKGEIIVVQINTYAAKVASVTKASGAADRYITLSKLSARDDLNTKYETEDFAAKDLVSYTCAYNKSSGQYEIQSVKALEKSVTGTLTQWTGTDTGNSKSSFTVDGTKYNYSNKADIRKADGATAATIASFKVNESELDVYLDDYGYALYVVGTKVADNYAVVIGLGNTNAYGSETFGATLLLADGTKKEVTAKYSTDDNGSTIGLSAINYTGTPNTTNSTVTYEPGTSNKNLVDDVVGDLVKYYVNKDGVYELTMAGLNANKDAATGKWSDAYDASVSSKTGVNFTNGRSLVTLTASGSTTSRYATTETLFFVATTNSSGKAVYNVYKGYENMPSVDTNAASYGVAYATNSDYRTQLDAVYFSAASLKGLSAEATFVVKKVDHTVISDSDGSYFVMPAIVDGEVTEVKVDAKKLGADSAALDNVGDTQVSGVISMSDIVKDKNGIYTGATFNTGEPSADFVSGKSYYATSEVVAPANGVIGFGSDNKNDAIYWAYTAKTNFFEVSENLKTITKIDAESVSTDGNDLVYFVADDDATASYKVVKTVIIVKVKEGTVAPVDTSYVFRDEANTVITDKVGLELEISAATNSVYVSTNDQIFLSKKNTTPPSVETATNVVFEYTYKTWDNTTKKWNEADTVTSAKVASAAAYIDGSDSATLNVPVAVNDKIQVTLTVRCDQLTQTFAPVMLTVVA